MKNTLFTYSLVAFSSWAIISCTGSTLESTDNTQTAVEETALTETPQVEPGTTVAAPDTIKKSIPSETEGTIGSAHLKINYHSPGVRGRVIWGGVVPYDQVWVTGAHKATTLQVDQPIVIGGKEIPAGKYALFTIPGRKAWTVILNKNWNQHLADDYNQQEDMVRLQVTPASQPKPQERLKYQVRSNSGNNGSIEISWADKLISIPVKG